MGERDPMAGFDMQMRIQKTNYIQQIGSNVSVRWAMYEHAKIPDIQPIVIDSVMSGHESVLDIGCSRMANLIRLREEKKHEGRLIGLDIDASSYEFTKMNRADWDKLNIEFVQGNVEDMHEIEDNSLDRVLAMFVLYHATDIEMGLNQIRRVLKPDGLAVIGTSTPRNKMFMRAFEQLIALSTGTQPPILMTSPFDSRNAQAYLSKKFELVCDPMIWKSEVEIYSTDLDDPGNKPLIDYFWAMGTLWQYYEPPLRGSLLRQAFKEQVLPIIQRQIDEQGKYSEPLERVYYICRKRSES